MDWTVPYIMFLLGLVMLLKGGDWFVDASVWTARVTGLPEVIIGATIVSIATTLPELFVSIIASYEGHPDIAIGNALGSVICNTGLILGVTTLISPSRIINPRIFCLNGLLLAAYGLFFCYLAADGMIGKTDSALLLMLFAVYILTNIMVIKYKKTDAGHREEISTRPCLQDTVKNLAKFLVGITLVLLGANMLVEYGSAIALHVGVPERVISLTLIALGTSLPELVTAFSALIKGHKFISMGNIVGANILNLSFVMGASSYFADIQVKPHMLYLDLPVTVLFIALLFVPCLIKKKTSRPQSALMVSIYAAYVLLLGYMHL
ncbi:MAG: calcium/sodium antiporter [Clostridia bacterium]|jgi:cation:H+ antiporter|nr:calcium/sodium antiporter [Clostridiales bacterium]